MLRIFYKFPKNYQICRINLMKSWWVKLWQWAKTKTDSVVVDDWYWRSAQHLASHRSYHCIGQNSVSSVSLFCDCFISLLFVECNNKRRYSIVPFQLIESIINPKLVWGPIIMSFDVYLMLCSHRYEDLWIVPRTRPIYGDSLWDL